MQSENTQQKIDTNELLVPDIQHNTKALVMNIADDDIEKALRLYENEDLAEIFEWYTVKLAKNYTVKDENNSLR